MSGEETDDTVVVAEPEELSDLERAARDFFSEEVFTETETDSNEEVDEEEDDLDSPGGDGDDSGEVDSSPASPLSDEDEIEISDGVKGTRGQIKSLLGLAGFLAENPAMAENIAMYVTGRIPTLTPATHTPDPSTINNPAAPTINPDGTPYSTKLPEDIDLDDPSVKRLWDESQGLRSELAAIKSTLGLHNDFVTAQQTQTAQAFVTQAKSAFQAAHNLTDDQMSKVEGLTTRLGVVPTLMSGMDPLTGLPRAINPIEALTQAFSTAYYMIPELRDRVVAKRVEADKNDRNKKQKLTALGGSSGSTPKNDRKPNPKTAAERRQAMIEEVASNHF